MGCNRERGRLRKVEESKANGINDSFKINFFVCFFRSLLYILGASLPTVCLAGKTKQKEGLRNKKVN